MGNAWDEDRIKSNLTELAKINTGGRTTDKISLSYFKGTIKVQHAGKGTSFKRSIPGLGDSIKEDSLKTSLVKLFAESKKVAGESKIIRGGFVTRGDIKEALSGLGRLAQTYAGDNERTQALQGILQEAREELNSGAGNEALERIYEQFLAKYRDHQTFSIQQLDLLPKSEGGVCKAMSLDWIRRKLFLQLDSLAVREAEQHPFGTSLRENAELNRSDYSRMRSLAMGTWLPMQKSLDELSGRGDNKQRFHHMRARHQEFELLQHAFLVENQVLPGGRSERIVFLKNEAEVDLRNILERCFQAVDRYQGRCGFVLGLRRSISAPPPRGHAVGIHIHGPPEMFRIHFLDPGIAEWEFHAPAEIEKFSEFWVDFTNLYGKAGGRFIKWDLDCYYQET